MTSPAGSRRPLVLWRAGVDWDAVTGTDRHLVTHLARWADVLWVDPPHSIVHVARERSPARVRPADLRAHADEVAHGVRRLRVFTPPFPLRPGMTAVTEWVLRRAITRAIRRSMGDRAVHAVVGTTPYHPLDVVAATRRLYFATDDFRAGATLMGRDADWMEAAQARRLGEADVAGAVSRTIVESWDPPPTRTFVLPNGCDTDHYADLDRVPPAADVSLPAPVVGMVGQFSPRTDLSLLEAVADAGLSLLLVGPRVDGWGGARFDALVARETVRWVGARSFDALPGYLKMIDLGITAYADTAFNRASSPLKTLEYLAAGRRALSTPLPAVAELGTDLVTCADGPDDFAAAALRLTATPPTPDEVARRRAFARRHSWPERARTLAHELGLGDPPLTGPPVTPAGR